MASGGEDPTTEAARAGVRGLCPNCGAVYEPDQEYCLACGERLFETPATLGHLLERWRHALPATDRSWVWPVLIALVVAILASISAILATRSSETNTIQALGPAVHPTTTSPPTTGAVTTISTVRTAPQTTTKPTTPPIKSAGLIAWPGPPAYTIVLASLPVSGGRASARQKALEALDAGLGDVGVLKSSDYSSLHPGYYVVFTGVFKSQGAALEHLAAARKAGFVSPYVKRVAS